MTSFVNTSPNFYSSFWAGEFTLQNKERMNQVCVVRLIPRL